MLHILELLHINLNKSSEYNDIYYKIKYYTTGNDYKS